MLYASKECEAWDRAGLDELRAFLLDESAAGRFVPSPSLPL